MKQLTDGISAIEPIGEVLPPEKKVKAKPCWNGGTAEESRAWNNAIDALRFGMVNDAVRRVYAK